MKKTFFIKVYNFIVLSIIVSIFDVVIILFITLVKKSFEKNSLTEGIPLFTAINSFLGYLGFISIVVLTLLIVVNTFLIACEVIGRIKHDSIENLVRSIKETVNIRHFLMQRQSTEKTSGIGKVTSYNPTNKSFNKAVKKSVIDISDDKLLAYFKVPRTRQAAELMTESRMSIKEEIASECPDYMISPPEREKHALWIEGTKIK